ncbi:MAG TPA: FecR domain-containing protein [Prosthecobacter sp.]
MNKLPFAIALVAVTQATSLHAGVFSFLTGKGRSQGNHVTTSAGAKAEARVDKNGSIVRVGSNTSAKVSDNGTVTLSKGVMLVSSGEGFLRRPPVQVSTPQGDVTVRGSAIVAALPDGSVKMTVLEGNAKGMMGDRSMALNAGQLMIQRHQSRDAVNVDLGALAATSTLLDNSQYQLPLPATPVIRQEVVDQAQSMGATLTLSGAGQDSSSQVANAAELKLAQNGSSTGLTRAVQVSGSTLQLGSSNYLSSGAVSLNTAGAQGGPLTFGAGTTTLGANGPSRTGLSISGSSIMYSPGSSTSAVITDSLGNPLPGAGSIRLSQTLVPAGTVLDPVPTNSSTSYPTVSGAVLSFSGASYGSVIYGSTSRISSSSLVLAPGITQTGGLTIASGAVTFTNGTVVNNGSGTLTLMTSGGLVTGGAAQVSGTTVTISNSVTYTGNTVLSSGTLVLRDAAAQQFLNGGMTVVGPGGVVLTPTSDNGVLTFQLSAGGTTPAPGGGTTAPVQVTPPATVP